MKFRLAVDDDEASFTSTRQPKLPPSCLVTRSRYDISIVLDALNRRTSLHMHPIPSNMAFITPPQLQVDTPYQLVGMNHRQVVPL
jgi:hypothetical protein